MSAIADPARAPFLLEGFRRDVDGAGSCLAAAGVRTRGRAAADDFESRGAAFRVEGGGRTQGVREGGPPRGFTTQKARGAFAFFAGQRGLDRLIFFMQPICQYPTAQLTGTFIFL
jgi:hypothetical protein